MRLIAKFTLFTVNHIRQHFCTTHFGGPFKSTKFNAKYDNFKFYKDFFGDVCIYGMYVRQNMKINTYIHSIPSL